MIGLVIIGHGNYAEGMNSSLQLIAGETENLEIVVFEGNSTDKLDSDIDQALSQLKDCEYVLFLADITGGSPFQAAAMKTMEHKNMAVIGGANLGMVIEAALTRNFAEDFDCFVDNLVEAGKNAIAKFELIEKEETIGDGI